MSIGKGQVPLMLALELLLSLRSNFNYISDCIHCVCLCGSKPLLGLRAWIQLFPSLHHTFCIFETGVWYWLIKPLCLCQLSQDWQWKMKGIDGVQRHDCAWSDSWNCLFFFLFPMSHIQSKIGLKKKKSLNERTFWQSFRDPSEAKRIGCPGESHGQQEKWFTAPQWSETLSTFLLTLLPHSALKNWKMDKPQELWWTLTAWRNCIKPIFFKSIFRNVSRCHVGRWWCNFYATIFVDNTIGTSELSPYLLPFNWTCTSSLTCCLGLFVCQWLPFF